MKKMNVLILSLIILLSTIFETITITNVKADTITYTYAYLNTDYVRTRSCPSTSCDALLHNGSTIYISL